MLRYILNDLFSLHDTEFEILDTPQCYILSQMKVASSYMGTVGSTQNISFEEESFKIKTMRYVVKSLIRTDWNSLLNGDVPTKPFIFLIRNPIQKFIAGFSEDILVPGMGVNYKFNNYFLHKETYLQQYLDISQNFWELGKLNSCKVLTEPPRDSDYTKRTEIQHMGSSIIWLSNLLKKLGSFTDSQVQVWDINLRELYTSLTNVGISLDDKFKEPINKRPSLIKNIAKYTLATKQGDFINNMLKPNMICWSNIIKEHHTKENINVDNVLKEWSIINKSYTVDDLSNTTTSELWCNEEHINKYDKRIDDFIKK